MRRWSVVLPMIALSLLSVMLSPSAHAASPPRVFGMVFADLQDQLHGTAVLADSSSFRFRRVHVAVEQDLDSTFMMRVQLEADENELTSKGRDAVFLKQVFLRWNTHRPYGDIVMGLSPTPAWAFAENVWGYRALEKTVMDLQGLGTATDMGVALQRAPDATHALGWHVMLANGAGPRPENTAGKKLMLALPWKHGDLAVEAMGDFEDERGSHDRWTAKLFAGWMHANDAAGVEVYRRVNANAGAANADVIPGGVSVFGRKALNEHWRAIARVDWTDPDRNVSNAGYRELYALLALDATPSPNVHLMPNVLMRSYSAKSSALPDRDADVTLRVTLWWNYR
jgi:hypothetical protein